ncbi:MAG: diguanylate cyclase domain-containing protein [Polyangiaceae bacterium]|jgi:GGDEF domain-containing protein/ActR/RegA family two-component response regulator
MNDVVEGGADALRVLAASQEEATLQTIAGVISPSGDLFFPTTDVAEALATAAGEKTEMAFVDVMLDGGAGLALVHHLTTAFPGIAVYALAPEANLELGSQAVALGAVGFMSSPPSGDALLHAVGEVRTRRGAERERVRLEADLAAANRRNLLMDRVVQLAHGGAHSEVAKAIMEALAEVSEARGAALYAAFDPPPNGECVRLASMGISQNLAATTRGEELLRVAMERGATVVPLGVAERLLALVILEGGEPARDRDVAAIASLAATVLAFVDAGEGRGREPVIDGRARVYTFAYLQDIAGREIDKAKRHGRRLAVAAILLDKEAGPKARAELEQVVLSVVRDTDVLARFDDQEFYLLLPETGALGAHACRRRLLIRAEGDRRARAPTSDRRGPVSTRSGRGGPLSIGVAAYPHDGATLDRLLRAARQRANDASRSAVHTLGLAPMPLGEIIDVLLARPMMGAGFGSPYPLDLVAPAMLSLVGAACREARRGGAANILVTARGGMGMASAARQAEGGDAPTVQLADVRSAPRCDNAEAIVINAEHGAWVCCGRRDEDRFRGVHAADPLLADLIAHRLAQASGTRWP